MTDEKLGLDLTEWMKDTEFAPPDSSRSARQVATRLPQTRQLGRWWWLPPYRRTPTHPPTTDQTTEYQPTSIPSANGQSATVTRSTNSMFSPAKAITAGALVFAIGGVLLIVQPFDQRGGSVPGAATDEFVEAVAVTGTSSAPQGCGLNYDGSYEDVGTAAYRWTCTTENYMPWSFSDPRLEGTVTRIAGEVNTGAGDGSALVDPCDADPDCEDGPSLYVAFVAFSIENEGGTWRERPRTWVQGRPNVEAMIFDGDGEYEGLAAVLRVTGPNEVFNGSIIDARLLPHAPENASAK